MTEPAGVTRKTVLDRVTARAWKDAAFRELLFGAPQDALLEEFGKIPSGFENVRFQAGDVDRIVSRKTPTGHRLVVRPKRGAEPLSVVARTVFGLSELVVVFYTRRCRYQCSFCTLPSTSAFSDVSFEDVRRQLEVAFARADTGLSGIRRISLGNEGSLLDERTFTREQLRHVLTACARLPSVEEIVLETRAEFVTEPLIREIVTTIAPSRLVLKIGLESADHTVRESILRKRMDLGTFESAVAILGRHRAGLACYVIVKASPDHSDADGRRDAIETCTYLKRLCGKHSVPLTLRINSMYRAEGSQWATWAAAREWKPPSVFDIAEVMYEVLEDDVPVFAGLYDEGLATADGHYEARPDFERWAMESLERYNETSELELLRTVATYRDGVQRA